MKKRFVKKEDESDATNELIQDLEFESLVCGAESVAVSQTSAWQRDDLTTCRQINVRSLRPRSCREATQQESEATTESHRYWSNHWQVLYFYSPGEYLQKPKQHSEDLFKKKK